MGTRITISCRRVMPPRNSCFRPLFRRMTTLYLMTRLLAAQIILQDDKEFELQGTFYGCNTSAFSYQVQINISRVFISNSTMIYVQVNLFYQHFL
ncbi:hypothetical protein GIB67_012634 [Kingdonia uniflora]|uniref:Uncharacterized protein n=1 Tax=Kingdonia uniflora TaxID=39325 RepID=A0A7J7NF01_9MAGN|nr:hypothetical protein GIB67_012634 [Kingdonia uniflora]